MSKLSIEKELKRLDKEYTSLYNSHTSRVRAVKASYKNLYHKCVNCGKRTQLGKLIMVIEKYWPDPESCSVETDTRFLICPHCKVMNRFYNRNMGNFVEERMAYMKVISWLPNPNYYHTKKEDIYGEQTYLELLKHKNVK